MKVRIASRSGAETGEVDAPDTLPEFLTWLSTQGNVTVTPPGKKVEDASWGGVEADPERWTIYLIDEYD